MLALIQLSETVVEEEVSALPLAISLAVGTLPALRASALRGRHGSNPDR